MKDPEYMKFPGLVDLHVHYREPGINIAETIESGTRAALLGGYVLTADMPNNPGKPTWTEEAMLEKHAIAAETAYIPTAFYAGRQPNTEPELVELAKMAPMAIALKLYGAPTTGNDKDYVATDFLSSIQLWDEVAHNKPIMFHAGKNNLESMISLVARHFGHHLHVCHVNDPEQVRAVEKAKQADLPVTCGVTPHHLVKSSHDVHSEGWFARMQPPLADQVDSEQLMDLLADGKIDVIETDHAPHTETDKWKAEFDNIDGIHDTDHTTCFGVPGIEFAAPLMFYQAKRGRLSWERLADAMSAKPAEILGVKLKNSTNVVWEMTEYRIDEELSTVESNARWTPYLGKLAVGALSAVQINGHELVAAESIINQHPRVVMNRGEEI